MRFLHILLLFIYIHVYLILLPILYRRRRRSVHQGCWYILLSSQHKSIRRIPCMTIQGLLQRHSILAQIFVQSFRVTVYVKANFIYLGAVIALYLAIARRPLRSCFRIMDYQHLTNLVKELTLKVTAFIREDLEMIPKP